MKSLKRSTLIDQLSLVYFKFLKSIDWKDELLLNGIKEGRNKFLSNAYLTLCEGKHSIVNYYSPEAYAILQQHSGKLPKGKLIFEHMVPKEKYIQTPCEIIMQTNLSDEQRLKEIKSLIHKYWHLASITAEQDKRMVHRKIMPEGWDHQNIFARYEAAGIQTIPNPIWEKSFG